MQTSGEAATQAPIEGVDLIRPMAKVMIGLVTFKLEGKPREASETLLRERVVGGEALPRPLAALAWKSGTVAMLLMVMVSPAASFCRDKQKGPSPADLPPPMCAARLNR